MPIGAKTRSVTCTMDTQEDIPQDIILLKEISDKIGTLNETVSNLGATLCKISLDMEENRKAQLTNKPVENVPDMFKSIMENLKSEMSKMYTEILNAKQEGNNREMDIEMEAMDRRNKFDTWERDLNTRKFNYWNYLKHRNEANTYKEWLMADPPFIPRKFREKPITGEPQEQLEIRRELAVQKMRAEIRILECKATQNEDKYRKIDDTIVEKIHKIKPTVIGEKLSEMWQTECKTEEEKSKAIWLKKEEWLKELPRQENTSQSQTTRTPNQPNKHQENRFSTNLGPRTSNQAPQYNPYNQQNRSRPYWKNQSNSTSRPRSQGPINVNRSNPNFSSFQPRGPQTNPNWRNMQMTNRSFQKMPENQPGRPERRFLSENGNIQVVI